MDMRLLWQPPVGSAACPSSVAKYFADAGYTVRLVRTERRQHQEYSLRMPLLGMDDADSTAEEFHATPAALVEYIGMLALNCDLEADEYLSQYRCHGRDQVVGNATCVQWRGMFAASTVRRLLGELREYIRQRPELPWVSLYCGGFADAPISFGHKEHAIGANGAGDNAVVIVLNADGLCQVTTVLGSNRSLAK